MIPAITKTIDNFVTDWKFKTKEQKIRVDIEVQQFLRTVVLQEEYGQYHLYYENKKRGLNNGRRNRRENTETDTGSGRVYQRDP